MSVIDPQNLASAPGGEASGNEIRCPGPGHSAEDRSLCVKVDPGAPDGFVVCTHAPPTTGVSAATTFGPRPAYDPFKPNSQRRYNGAGQPKGKIVVEYNYTDESRSLLYQVVRYYPKGFRQRRPDGSSGWIWSLGEKRRVLYRWPELLKYPDATVFVCEGEKDADRVASLEHCATTAAGGKWTDDCAKALAGRHVIILQDNDGAKKALDVAQALHGTAKTIGIVLYQTFQTGATSRIGSTPTRSTTEKCSLASTWMRRNGRQQQSLMRLRNNRFRGLICRSGTVSLYRPANGRSVTASRSIKQRCFREKAAPARALLS